MKLYYQFFVSDNILYYGTGYCAVMFMILSNASAQDVLCLVPNEFVKVA